MGVQVIPKLVYKAQHCCADCWILPNRIVLCTKLTSHCQGSVCQGSVAMDQSDCTVLYTKLTSGCQGSVAMDPLAFLIYLPAINNLKPTIHTKLSTISKLYPGTPDLATSYQQSQTYQLYPYQAINNLKAISRYS